MCLGFDEGVQWCPFDINEIVSFDSVGCLADHIPVAIECDVAEGFFVGEQVVNAPDDPFVAIGNGDVDCLS